MENEKPTVSAMNSMYLLFSIACTGQRWAYYLLALSLSKVDLN